MKKIVITILILSFVYAQNINSIFSQESVDINKNSMQLNQDMDLTSIEKLTYTPIEMPIDPDTYILGPGDLLGVNIISAVNTSLPIRINPAGEIMIPSVGILNVSGISLSEAKIKISDYIVETALRNSVVNVTLMDIRRFKIQILGAIHSPGYIYVTPVDKVFDAIEKGGGVQKFAHPDIIRIIRGEKTIEVKLKEYLSGNDPSQNISLKDGDVIFVPFSEYAKSMDIFSGAYNNHQVIVYGFVNRGNSGNSFTYFPGYTARDYIAMAGGTKEQGSSFRSGNIHKTKIYRSNGEKIKHAIDEVVQPGDMIEVPPSMLYQIVGGDGVISVLASITSIASSTYIAYIIAQGK